MAAIFKKSLCKFSLLISANALVRVPTHLNYQKTSNLKERKNGVTAKKRE